MTVYRFFKMAAGSHVGFDMGNAGSVIVGPSLVLKLDLIGFIFSDILLIRFF